MTTKGNRNKKAPLPTPAAHRHSFAVGSVLAASAPMQTFVDRPSADHRRVYREIIRLEPPSPVKRARLEAAALGSSNTAAAGPFSAVPEPWESERYPMEGDDDDPLLPDLPPMPNPQTFKPAVRFFALLQWD